MAADSSPERRPAQLPDGYKACTKDAPMPKGDKGRWVHVDAVNDGDDYGGLSGGGDYEHYTCPNCGKAFYVELPD